MIELLRHFLGAKNFNIVKTVTLLVHAGLFWCFHNLPNSDMDYGIFNMRRPVIFLHCLYTTGTSVYSLIRRTFVESAQNFDSGENSGRAQSLARNGHPSIW